MRRKLLLLIATFAAASSANAANLLTNGSFEDPNIVANNTYTLYPLGSTAITGWTVVGGEIQLTPDTYFVPDRKVMFSEIVGLGSIQN